MATNRSLVYRRRICLDQRPELDKEAAAATDIHNAAHLLIFAEVVHQIVAGQYLVDNATAHRLAALHLLSECGTIAGAAASKTRHHLQHNLQHYISALAHYNRTESDVIVSTVGRPPQLAPALWMDGFLTPCTTPPLHHPGLHLGRVRALHHVTTRGTAPVH